MSANSDSIETTPLSRDTATADSLARECPEPSHLSVAGPLPMGRLSAWRSARWALVSLLLGIVALAFTSALCLPVFRFLEKIDFDNFFDTARQFAASSGAITIVALILLLDARRSRFLPYLLVSLAVGGLSNEVIKQCSGRMRPEYTVLQKERERTQLGWFMQKHPHVPLRIEKTDQWIPLGSRPMFDDIFSSFPSGHANTAFVLAAYLSIMYPRARLVWLVYAFGCALSRVRWRRHFSEDVLIGGSMGWLVAYWVFTWSWPGQLGAWLAVKSALFWSRLASTLR